jgi:hypothetical protein
MFSSIAPLRADPHLRDVVAAEDAHRRIGVAVALAGLAARAPFAVQEALHIGQEGDELVVMPLVELAGVAGELVGHVFPRTVRQLAQDVPRPAPAVGVRWHRHQPQRPQQNLAQVAHQRLVGGANGRGGCGGAQGFTGGLVHGGPRALWLRGRAPSIRPRPPGRQAK